MKYSLGYNTWSKAEHLAIKKVLKSGNFTMGKKVQEFENKFAKHFGSKFAVMVNSGSSANLLMMSVLKYFPKYLLKKTKKPNIIVPAIGWSTSYFPINQCGFKLKFVDVNLESLNLDSKNIKKAIDKDTVAILAINLLGNPCNFVQLKKIAYKENLILLEDNCESLGSKYKKKFTGNFGLMGTQSFFFAHHLQTMEGGMILTNNKNIYDILKSLRAHGWVRNLSKKNQLYKKRNDNFKDNFTFILPGFCLRPLEINAAAGIEQLKKFKSFMKVRLKNAKIFKRLFNNKEWCIIQLVKKDTLSSWYGFNLILKNVLQGKRDRIIRKLIKNKIEVRPTMTGNFTNNPVKKFLDYDVSGNLKNSEFIDKNGFFFGNYPKNLEKELNLVYKLISEEIK